MFNTFIQSWRIYLRSWRFLVLLSSGIALLVLAIKTITDAISIVDLQRGYELYDPVHAMLPQAMDFSNIIFFITYSSVILVILDGLFRSPANLINYAFAIAIMKFLRSVSMYLVPLEPPKGMVLLADPLVFAFTNNHVIPVKDLFFSGHSATIMILLMAAKSYWVKKWMTLMCVILPFLLLWQRVHYTIDVIAGLIVGVIIYKTVEMFVEHLLKDEFAFAGRLQHD